MSDIYVMRDILKSVEQGKNVATATIISTKGSTPRKIGTTMGILEDGNIIGTIGGGKFEKHIIDLALEAIKMGQTKRVDLVLDQDELKMSCGGEAEVFIDVYTSKPKLLIVGGGHVGKAIYDVAKYLNFHIYIFEDRKELLEDGRFEGASSLIVGSIEENLRDFYIDNNTYITIVTRGHMYDEIALESVMDRGARYLGVIGSKSKVRTMRDSLLSKGVGEESLDQIYSPIGLKICDGSPEEIAISIMAEILSIKNNGELRHMKLK